MSAISATELTLGYLTLPAASAAGLLGSYLTRNADWSVRTLPSATTVASSVRSRVEEKVGTVRRYGLPPGVCAVESALAIFSEITRIRPACARRPEVAILIDRAKSAPSFAIITFSNSYLSLLFEHDLFGKPVATFPDHALALADRGLQKMQALAVERGHRRIVHLVGGDLEHLVLEVDGIAGGPGLAGAPAAVAGDGGAAAGRGGEADGGAA